jgi:hypothetical protein
MAHTTPRRTTSLIKLVETSQLGISTFWWSFTVLLLLLLVLLQ